MIRIRKMRKMLEQRKVERREKVKHCPKTGVDKIKTRRQVKSWETRKMAESEQKRA